MSQQPACGKLRPVPSSSPVWCHVDPVWLSGPHARGTAIPASSETRNLKPPNPVILQTTLISLPAGGGTGLKNSAHKLPRGESKPTSGGPSRLAQLWKRAAGSQPALPRLPSEPPAVGLGG